MAVKYEPSAPSWWISDLFARDHEALTRALQVSISTTTTTSSSNDETLAINPAHAPISSSSSSSHLLPFFKPEQIPTTPDRIRHPASGRIRKRKSRASKRSPTTYIAADAANFREMVQQVTGAPICELDRPMEPGARPGTSRGGAAAGCCLPLPTLDTSAFLLDRPELGGSADIGGFSTAEPAVEGLDLGFDPMQSFRSPFPTLESWGVM